MMAPTTYVNKDHHIRECEPDKRAHTNKQGERSSPVVPSRSSLAGLPGRDILSPVVFIGNSLLTRRHSLTRHLNDDVELEGIKVLLVGRAGRFRSVKERRRLEQLFDYRVS